MGRGGDPDLPQHSARIRNRGRFDEPGCHELEERLVVDDIEAETSPRSSNDLDQPPGPLPGDRRCRAGGAEVEVEFLLAGEQFLPRRLEQGGEFAVGVADPRCSSTLSRRPCLAAICTAVAPEAMRTLRM